MEYTEKQIPPDVIARTPLMKPDWLPSLARMRFHSHAPRWNTECGDRITLEDLEFIRAFEEKLCSRNNLFSSDVPDEKIQEWIALMVPRSGWFREMTAGINITNDFFSIKPMTRSDLQLSLGKIVPYDESLDRLVVNPTSGTTGQPIPCPNHPRAVGCYDSMIKYALSMHGVVPLYDHTVTAAVQLCAQASTITYCTLHSTLNGAGFAKVNLYPHEWNSPVSAEKFISDMAPVFYSGDPFSFSYALNMGLTYRPRAVVSTATTLTSGLRDQIAKTWECPVIDLYSLNETGPIAYSCPENPEHFHILPCDIFVEILDDGGAPVAPGSTGRIAVTGGRNPYLPLLRYLTGDTGSMDFSPCGCGEKSPRITGLSGREQVVFSASDGTPVNSIDIARILRAYPVAGFSFIQHSGLSCSLAIRPLYSFNRVTIDRIRNEILDLFNRSVSLTIDQNAGDELFKQKPFIKE